uniref:Uncharacterized protein n=1 Tax=Siphoviridae sp. ctiOl67 TaxID=2825622 RepID=A0A8S5QIX9_9CAUD|nr:MAG TPA: hypothetical protein [Siphoviridae sp. ctiOl67]
MTISTYMVQLLSYIKIHSIVGIKLNKMIHMI